MRVSLYYCLVSMLLSMGFTVYASAQLLDNEGRAGLRAITAALLTFSTDDSLSGGVFSIENDEPGLPDTELSLLKTWVEIPLSDSEARFVPLLELSPSYLELSQDELGGGASFTVNSWGLGAGLGLRMRLADVIEVTPRIKVGYSRLDYEFQVPGADPSILDAISPSLNTWTYQPSLEVLLKTQLNEQERLALFRTNVSYLLVQATTSNTELADFSEKSVVWKNTLALEEPVDIFRESSPLVFRPSFALIELFGDARDAFEFNNFFEAGLDVFSLSVGEPYFSELGFGIRYLFEDEITGWRFGLFGDFS